MASEWYYQENGESVGPISNKELQVRAASGQLQPGHLIWREGLAEYVPAHKVRGLFPKAADAAPVENHPGTAEPAPDVGAAATTLPVAAESVDAKSLLTTIREANQKPIGLVIGLLLSIIVGLGLLLVFQQSAAVQLPGVAAATPAASLSQAMTREEFTAKVDALKNPCKREALYKAVGKPMRVQVLDGQFTGLYWYWQCQDGLIQMVLFNPDVGISPANDKTLAYISKINQL